MKKGIFDAVDLAKYINMKYKEIMENEELRISPLKLQKSLYFCFAYWGAFAHKGNIYQNELTDKLDEYLFSNEIEAWVYGPVVPDVYRKYKEENIPDIDEQELFENHEYVKEFIDGILDDVLKASDFRLVTISHEDNCWKRHFKETEENHSESIPKNEIIEEYVSQV